MTLKQSFKDIENLSLVKTIFNYIECRYLSGEIYLALKDLMNDIRHDKRRLLSGTSFKRRVHPDRIRVRNKASWQIIIDEYLADWAREKMTLLSPHRPDRFVPF